MEVAEENIGRIYAICERRCSVLPRVYKRLLLVLCFPEMESGIGGAIEANGAALVLAVRADAPEHRGRGRGFPFEDGSGEGVDRRGGEEFGDQGLEGSGVVVVFPEVSLDGDDSFEQANIDFPFTRLI